MLDLNYRHPLAETAHLALPGFSAEPQAQGTSFEIHARHANLPSAAAALLPDEPNRCLSDGEWRALWLRPNGWLLINPRPAASLDSRLVEASRSGELRFVDVSHARTGFALAGEEMRTILAKGTTLDLRSSSFFAGQCARTVCAGFSVLLDHQENRIMVYVDSALAVAFWAWLRKAAVFSDAKTTSRPFS